MERRLQLYTDLRDECVCVYAAVTFAYFDNSIRQTEERFFFNLSFFLMIQTEQLFCLFFSWYFVNYRSLTAKALKYIRLFSTVPYYCFEEMMR